MSTYFVYRIKCTDEATYKYWTLLDTDPSPTTCPTNSAHTVDVASVVIIKTIADNIVSIREESVETGGNYCGETLVMDAATGPNVSTTFDWTWPIPISVINMKFISEEDNRGDHACNVIGPNTVVGILVAGAATGATGFYVNSTVTDNSLIGYELDLLNGTNYDNNALGRILSINKETGLVKTESGTSQSFPAFTTYVRQTVIPVRSFTFGAPGHHAIGDNKIGGSYLPAGVISRVIYTNMDSHAKRFISLVEYLY